MAQTPANEPKSIVSMMQYVEVVANNIFEVTHGKALASMPMDFNTISVVPIGATKGLFSVNGYLKLSETAGADKDEMEAKNMKEVRGDPEAIKEGREALTKMPGAMNCLRSCWCCCCPCG